MNLKAILFVACLANVCFANCGCMIFAPEKTLQNLRRILPISTSALSNEQNAQESPVYIQTLSDHAHD